MSTPTLRDIFLAAREEHEIAAKFWRFLSDAMVVNGMYPPPFGYMMDHDSALLDAVEDLAALQGEENDPITQAIVDLLSERVREQPFEAKAIATAVRDVCDEAASIEKAIVHRSAESPRVNPWKQG
jgi:hypothetical protein